MQGCSGERRENSVPLLLHMPWKYGAVKFSKFINRKLPLERHVVILTKHWLSVGAFVKQGLLNGTCELCYLRVSKQLIKFVFCLINYVQTIELN